MFPFLQSLEASEAQRYEWGAYCGRNWRYREYFSDKLYGLGVLKSEVSERGWREGVGDQYHPECSKNCPPEFPPPLLIGGA